MYLYYFYHSYKPYIEYYDDIIILDNNIVMAEGLTPGPGLI